MVVVGGWVMVGYGVCGETGLTQTCRDVVIPSRAMIIRLSCYQLSASGVSLVGVHLENRLQVIRYLWSDFQTLTSCWTRQQHFGGIKVD